KLLSRFVLFFLFFRGLNVICKQAPACRFKKVAFTPGPRCKSDVKCPFLSAFESRNNFLRRSDEAERTSKIIRRAEREHAYGNAAVDEPRGNLCGSPVPAGGKHEVGLLLESFLEAGFFGRLISGVMSSFG